MTLVDSLNALSQEQFAEIIDRRHPGYKKNLDHWNFLESTYKGGRQWFKDHIFQYLKEGDNEYKDRVERAYRFNHTRESVDLVNKYIFKADVNRLKEEAPKSVKKFWRESSLRRRKIGDFMNTVSAKSSIFGRAWVCVDNNKSDDVVTIADEKSSDTRIYAYVITPLDVLDYGLDSNGDLTWFMHHVTIREDDSPLSDGDTITCYKIWTRTEWVLIEESGSKEDRKFSIRENGSNPIGVVPFVPVDHVVDENNYEGVGLIDDTAYLDRAVANYLSNLDAIIQDQTFSQLTIPAQGVIPEKDDVQDDLVAVSTKRILAYDSQGGGKPEYISPDAAQAGVIMAVIEKIISEIYHTIGMAGERTKQDNSMGIDNSSGVAKAYDFERMNAMLAAKASALETAENRIISLVALWAGEKLPELEDDRQYVQYPRSFDVRGLYDEFEISQNLALVNAPKELRREQMKSVVRKLFPTIGSSRLADLMKEIEDEWLEMDESLLTPAMTGDNPVKENSQGQVTTETELND